MFEKEIWKDVKGFEGLYQVSNLGRVKSLERLVKQYNGHKKIEYKIKEKILKLNTDRYGYYQVRLANNGIVKTKKIHRLVAEAFLDNHKNLPCINHKDENKKNNNIDNLEFCTYKYNTNYGNAIDKRRKKRMKKILQYTKENILIKEYSSINEAKDFLKINDKGNISLVCNGKRKTAYGYIWRWSNE